MRVFVRKALCFSAIAGFLLSGLGLAKGFADVPNQQSEASEIKELIDSLKPFAWFHVMTPEERKKLKALAEIVSQKTALLSDPAITKAEPIQLSTYNQISDYIQLKLKAQDQLASDLDDQSFQSLKGLYSPNEMISLVEPLEQNLPVSSEAYQKLLKLRGIAKSVDSLAPALKYELIQFRSMVDQAIAKQKELTISAEDQKKYLNEFADLNKKIQSADRASIKLKILSGNEKQAIEKELESTQKTLEELKKDEPFAPFQSQLLAALQLYSEKLKAQYDLQASLDQNSKEDLDLLDKIIKDYAAFGSIQAHVLEEDTTLTETQRNQLIGLGAKVKKFQFRTTNAHLVQRLKEMAKEIDLVLSLDSPKSLTQYDEFSKLPSDDCLAALGSEDQKQIQEFKAALTEVMKINDASEPCCKPNFATEAAPQLKKMSEKARRGYLAMLNSGSYFFSKSERKKWFETAKSASSSEIEAQPYAAQPEKLSLYPRVSGSGQFQTNCATCSGYEASGSYYNYAKFRFPEPSRRTLEDIQVFCHEADQLAKNDPETVAQLIFARLNSTSDHPCPEFSGASTGYAEEPKYGLSVSAETLQAFFDLGVGLHPGGGYALLNALKAEGLGHLGLTDAEVQAIHAYAKSFYVPVNRALFENDKEAVKIYRPFIEVMTSGLRKMPAYKGLLRRGADLPKSVLDQHQVGSIITYPSFTSTSLEQGFPSYLQTRILIYSKTCRYVDPIAIPNEQEAICLPGTQFKVLYKDKHHLILREVASP